MILLDTNVVTEPLRPAPDARVIEWIDAQPVETIFLSAITVAELRAGVALLPAGKRRSGLHQSLEKCVLPLFAGRVLLFDLACTKAYTELMAKARAAGLGVRRCYRRWLHGIVYRGRRGHSAHPRQQHPGARCGHGCMSPHRVRAFVDARGGLRRDRASSYAPWLGMKTAHDCARRSGCMSDSEGQRTTRPAVLGNILGMGMSMSILLRGADHGNFIGQMPTGPRVVRTSST